VKARALLLIAPAVLLVLFAALHRSPTGGVSETAAPGQQAARAERVGRRLVVVIVDSLRQATLRKPGVMPHLLALAEDGETSRFALLTCSANFSLPCLQTLMEGRQSPFATGLHNFTGIQGGEENIASSLQAAGLRLAIVGDHTLVDLYGRHAAAAWGVESVAGDPLQRDLAAVSQAVEWLEARPAFDALLLHVPGPDKAAHHKGPGTAAYDEHHRRLDEALARVWERIDPAADDLMIMGDHGHDDRGDHTRQSLVLMRGPRLAEMLARREATRREAPRDQLFKFMPLFSLALL
jgi:predicted AlkP superfamily pyrophosphatase or phosphodiesterase